jgi:hypothetical protein
MTKIKTVQYSFIGTKHLQKIVNSQHKTPTPQLKWTSTRLSKSLTILKHLADTVSVLSQQYWVLCQRKW